MAALLVPVLAYSAIYAVNTGHFGLGRMDGSCTDESASSPIAATPGSPPRRGRFASAPSATATRELRSTFGTQTALHAGCSGG